NRKRQDVQEKVLRQALEQADEQKSQAALVVAGDGWAPGVVGIVAAKLVDRFARPAFVIAMEGAVGRGSARSFGGFNLYLARTISSSSAPASSATASTSRSPCATGCTPATASASTWPTTRPSPAPVCAPPSSPRSTPGAASSACGCGCAIYNWRREQAPLATDRHHPRHLGPARRHPDPQAPVRRGHRQALRSGLASARRLTRLRDCA